MMRQVHAPKARTEKWFVYLAVDRDDRIYTGISTDPARRVYEHNYCKRGAKWARMARPIVLLACLPSPHAGELLTHSEALKVEHTLKQMQPARKLLHLCSLGAKKYLICSMSRWSKLLAHQKRK